MKINFFLITVLQLLILFYSSFGYHEFKLFFVFLELVVSLFNLKYLKVNRYLLTLIILLIFTNIWALNSIIFCVFSYLFAKRLTLFNPKTLSKIFKFCIYIFSFYIIVQALQGVNPNLLINASRNHIAVPFILFGSINLFLEKKNNLKTNYLIYFLIFLISLWSISRSNIISSSFLLLLSIFHNSGENKNQHLNISLFIVLGITIFLFHNYELIKGYLFEKSFTFIKFYDARNSILGNERIGMIYDFIANLKGHEFLTGKTIDYNIHNSYMAFYSNFGVIAIFCLILFFIKTRKNILYLAPILIRASTDTILFLNAELDFIPLYFVLI